MSKYEKEDKKDSIENFDKTKSKNKKTSKKKFKSKKYIIENEKERKWN